MLARPLLVEERSCWRTFMEKTSLAITLLGVALMIVGAGLVVVG